MNLREKVIVVTGAGGALGRAICRRFLDEHCEGLVLTDVDEGSLSEALSSLDNDPRLMGVVANVTDRDAVESVVDVAVERHGRLDVLVNNAGLLSRSARLHNVDSDEWHHVLDVNLMGTVNGITSALRVMRPRRSGAIVNTASVAGLTAWSHSGPYCVSKAAIIHLTRVTALEYASEGIRANCVCPGSFESTMFDSLPQQVIDAVAVKHPLGIGKAGDIAGAYVYLASGDSDWTTGSALIVDGGFTLP